MSILTSPLFPNKGVLTISKANILIDDSGNVRIADFQLVFIIDRSEFTTDKIAGAARWTAPELMDPRGSQGDLSQPMYTKMTDMFALAMTMIEVSHHYTL